ncbi:DUF4245 domain-containing protein [Homoserinibacter sp. GY 40078]|uniref:DUF4245 domain-containing protein n=1 Tax=Homoserinibacter sp. GY 40078 TaxID=2603275 RepID=UPI00164FB89B|nr:DUF4245 domain-containing protein [Homoserinibacter sp. GY 40078]
MSPRESGRDEHGRPIVAELGRAETPQETADRKDAAREKRRTNQTALNLGIATIVSLLAALILVFAVGLIDTGSRIEPVDYVAEGAAAQQAVEVPLVVPELPDGWAANRATLSTGSDGVTVWQIGFVTPEGRYLAIVQGIDANASWVDDQVRGEPADGERTMGGMQWQAHDRRDADDIGNVAYALVAEAGTSTIVIAGTADDEEFEVLAGAVAKELG